MSTSEIVYVKVYAKVYSSIDSRNFTEDEAEVDIHVFTINKEDLNYLNITKKIQEMTKRPIMELKYKDYEGDWVMMDNHFAYEHAFYGHEIKASLKIRALCKVF